MHLSSSEYEILIFKVNVKSPGIIMAWISLEQFRNRPVDLNLTKFAT